MGYAGQGAHPGWAPAAAAGPDPYGAATGPPGPAAMRRPPFGIGDLLLAAGGLLFFIGSFLTWIFLDLGTFANPCTDISDPDLRESCEQSIGSIASGFDTNAWDLITTSAAAVVMILLAMAAVGIGLRLLPAPPGLRLGMTAAVLVVDVVVVTYISFVDFSSLGSDLAESAGGGVSLGLGFWLALTGLLAANAGVFVAHRMSGPAAQSGR